MSPAFETPVDEGTLVKPSSSPKVFWILVVVPSLFLTFSSSREGSKTFTRSEILRRLFLMQCTVIFDSSRLDAISRLLENDNRYTMAQCNGCDAFNYLDDYWNTAMDDTISQQWPLKLIRKEPDWLWNLFMSEGLDSYKHDFLREIYRALRNNAPRLVVIGIRALLEQVMIEKVGDAGNFVQNLDRFQQEGFISSIQRSAIEPVIEAGHASTHRRFKASTEQISDLLDVTESLIATIYIHRAMLANMDIPPRPARAKRVKPTA